MEQNSGSEVVLLNLPGGTTQQSEICWAVHYLLITCQMVLLQYSKTA